MRFCIVLLLSFSVFLNVWAEEGTLRIAAASSLQEVMNECVEAFQKKYPDIRVEVVYGSSGKLYHQITNGAPFDMYFPADKTYVEGLYKKGVGESVPQVFAEGRLAIWSAASDLKNRKADFLLSDKVKKIAIANPKLAPYGAAAVEYLRNIGVFEAVKSKLVYGENVSQALHFAVTGAADVVITSYSLLAQDKTRSGKVHLPAMDLYTAPEQSFVNIKGSANAQQARLFGQFLTTPDVLKRWEKYGYLQKTAK